MVNFVRVRGRELPRSASRCLEFTIISYQGPGRRLLAGPTCGPCCFQDPVCLPLGPLGWTASTVVLYYLNVVAVFARMLSKYGPRKSRHVPDGRRGLAGVCHAEGGCVHLSRPPAIVTASVNEGVRVSPVVGGRPKKILTAFCLQRR